MPDDNDEDKAYQKQYHTHGRTQGPGARGPELVFENVAVKRAVDTTEKTRRDKGSKCRNKHQNEADGGADPVQRPGNFQKRPPGLGTIDVGDLQEFKVEIEQ